MDRELQKKFKENDEAALITAVVGEIGNNCFDHNLGQWRDIPGCYFHYGQQDSFVWIVVADRGQGIFASLSRVAADITDDDKALEAAFQRRLSGRSPEQRGNGLKFVRSIINGNVNRGLFFSSGKAHRLFGGLGSLGHEMVKGMVATGIGAFALVGWKTEL